MNHNIENTYREKRKDEHIKFFLESRPQNTNGFEDVVLQNNPLPELDFDEINTECLFLNKRINFPLLINAITGGTRYGSEINRKLANIAQKHNIAMAVGSQTIAINNKEAEDSFKIARKTNEKGILLANVSAASPPSNAMKAVEMIEANGLQLHLNVAQELAMKEGDRHFRGILDNIREIVKKVQVPVIVKEVGFGMSYEAARKLYEAGVRHLDIGGKGGTNFVEIENLRGLKDGESVNRDFSFLYHWGISTAMSLLECRQVNRDMCVIASGGILKSEEILKALCMGADMVGVSGVVLRELLENGEESADRLVERLIYEVRVMMVLLGVKDVRDLRKVRYLVKGELGEMYRGKFV